MSEWQNFKWYLGTDETAWFPVRFCALWDDGVHSWLTLYEFMSIAGYGCKHLRIDTRELERQGIEFRVVNYDEHPERALFQGGAWRLSCWLVANTSIGAYGSCYNSRVKGVIPYEIF